MIELISKVNSIDALLHKAQAYAEWLQVTKTREKTTYSKCSRKCPDKLFRFLFVQMEICSQIIHHHRSNDVFRHVMPLNSSIHSFRHTISFILIV